MFLFSDCSFRARAQSRSDGARTRNRNQPPNAFACDDIDCLAISGTEYGAAVDCDNESTVQRSITSTSTAIRCSWAGLGDFPAGAVLLRQVLVGFRAIAGQLLAVPLE